MDKIGAGYESLDDQGLPGGREATTMVNVKGCPILVWQLSRLVTCFAIISCLGCNIPLELAEQFHLKGNRAQEVESRLKYYGFALSLRPAHNDFDIDRAKTSFNMGSLCREYFRFDEARRHFEKAIEWGDDRLRSKAYLGISKIETNLGAEVSAAECQQLAMKYAVSETKYLEEYRAAVTDWANAMVTGVVRSDSVYQMVALELEQAIEHMESRINSLSTDDSTNLGALYDLLGICHLRLDQCDLCEKFERYAMRLNRDEHYRADRLGNTALCLSNVGEKDRALRLLRMALRKRQLTKEPNPPGMANTLDNFAIVFSQYDLLDSALHYCLKSIAQLANMELPDMRSADLQHMDIRFQMDVLNYLERFLEITDDKHGGSHKYTDAVLLLLDALVDQIRLSHTWYTDKQFWQSRTAAIYQRAIEKYYFDGDWQRMFYYLEKSKAISLKEHFLRSAHSYFSEDSLFRLERKIFSQIDELEQANMSEDKVDWTDSIVVLKSRYRGILTSINERNQQLFAGRAATKLSDLQSELTPGEYVLMFNQSENWMYWMMVGQDEIRTQQLPLDSIKGEVMRWQDLLRQSPVELSLKKSRIRKAELKRTSTYLRRSLLPPVLDGVKKLIIVPSGCMYQVPFSVLLGFDDQAQVAQIDVSYCPSVSMLQLMKAHQNERSVWLGVAPDFSAQLGGVGYPPLYYNQQEVEAISKIMSGQGIFRSMTRDEFYRAVEDIGVLHLATHATMSIDRDIGPKVILGNYAESKFTTSLADILYRAPPFNMVVLSACETAQGYLADGEGLQSLATSFAGSGTSSIVATLWPVDDQATQQIMESFYAFLKLGKNRSAAMRLAQQTYISGADYTGKDPYYWAPFLVIGDAGPLTFNQGLDWRLILGSLILLGFILWKSYRSEIDTNLN